MRLWPFVLLGLAISAHAASVMEGTQAWPKATVAYHFEPQLLKAVGATGKDCTGWARWQHATQAYKACAAMDAWTTATGVHFVLDERRIDSLYIKAGSTATQATLGHLPAFNRMEIEAGATYGAVLHEFGHVLGLMHEHQRPDRDQYLTFAPFLRNDIDYCGLTISAVCSDVRGAFPIVRVQMSSDYDPCSLMHYLSNQTPRHREDPRWGQIFTLTKKGQAALDTCTQQFMALPARCRKPGQKCAISHDDAMIVRRFQKVS